ncbi:MAG: class I SAM-dependent methyltransferase [Acidobacteriota bacterium]
MGDHGRGAPGEGASVQIVLCMDTEGPCADPGRPELLATWAAVDRAMDRLFDPGFRARFPDRTGGHLRIGWFFLTWSGFTTNPRQRAMGYHAVRDHYCGRWGAAITRFGDEHCWHYHHPAASGVGNEWGLEWRQPREYDQILSRQILERDWFPACYRAGGTIMDNESSRWVDAWFPIDYSNRAPVQVPGLVDWSTGPAEWALYHPSPEDFRQPGTGRRRMARTLDLETHISLLSDADISQAFERAAAGRRALLAVFDHDYRDIADRLDQFRSRVAEVAARYPDVCWQYAAPIEAVRRYLEAAPPRPLRIEAMRRGASVWVWTSEPIHQSVPWLSVQMRDGSVQHVAEGLTRVDQTHWRWDPPPEREWVAAGFGASTDLGTSATVRITPSDEGPRGFGDSVVESDGRHPRSIWQHSTLFPELCVERASGDAPETDSVAQAVAWLGPRLAPGMRVLDAGCAAGHAWHTLRPLGIEYHGVDASGRAIDIGRSALWRAGLTADRLRALDIIDLPPAERYDAVLCLNTLLYFPDFRQPLEALARAADRWLVVRASFGDRTEVRYLPDVLLAPGFETLRAYFSIFGRADVEAFLAAEGFELEWQADRRQTEKFGGQPEVVGGIAIPYEFLLAQRVRPRPAPADILGDTLTEVARGWRERRAGGPRRP